MSIDLINNLLDKLKAKTGREWSILDLMQLAQKLPNLNGNNIDALLDELNQMGLELPEDTKEKVLQKLEENPNLSLEDIQQVKRKVKKRTSKDKSASTSTSTSKKTKRPSKDKKKSLFEQVQQLQKSKSNKKKSKE